jgi:hypothetical protein
LFHVIRDDLQQSNGDPALIFDGRLIHQWRQITDQLQLLDEGINDIQALDNLLDQSSTAG